MDDRHRQRECDWSSAMIAARSGDNAAYQWLLGEMAAALRPLVRRQLMRLGLGPDDAEDVVQDTLLALHQKRDTWDGARPILPWVHAIARYKVLDAARRFRRVGRAIDAQPVEDLAELLPAPEPAHDLRGLDLGALLDKLPARERGIVKGLALDGESVAALARRLGIGETAVRVAFHRGLSKLAPSPA